MPPGNRRWSNWAGLKSASLPMHVQHWLCCNLQQNRAHIMTRQLFHMHYNHEIHFYWFQNLQMYMLSAYQAPFLLLTLHELGDFTFQWKDHLTSFLIFIHASYHGFYHSRRHWLHVNKPIKHCHENKGINNQEWRAKVTIQPYCNACAMVERWESCCSYRDLNIWYFASWYFFTLGSEDGFTTWKTNIFES